MPLPASARSILDCGVRLPQTRLMGDPLRDEDFYSNVGRGSYGLHYFWLLNPKRPPWFRAAVLLLPVLVALTLAVLFVVGVTNGSATGGGGQP